MLSSFFSLDDSMMSCQYVDDMESLSLELCVDPFVSRGVSIELGIYQ